VCGWEVLYPFESEDTELLRAAKEEAFASPTAISQLVFFVDIRCG